MIEELTDKQKTKWLRRYSKLVLGEIERCMTVPEDYQTREKLNLLRRLVRVQSAFEDEAYPNVGGKRK